MSRGTGPGRSRRRQAEATCGTIPVSADAPGPRSLRCPESTAPQVYEEVLNVRDKTMDPKASMPATESQRDDFLIDEIEVEDLAIDGICGVY